METLVRIIVIAIMALTTTAPTRAQPLEFGRGEIMSRLGFDEETIAELADEGYIAPDDPAQWPAFIYNYMAKSIAVTTERLDAIPKPTLRQDLDPASVVETFMWHIRRNELEEALSLCRTTGNGASVRPVRPNDYMVRLSLLFGTMLNHTNSDAESTEPYWMDIEASVVGDSRSVSEADWSLVRGNLIMSDGNRSYFTWTLTIFDDDITEGYFQLRKHMDMWYIMLPTAPQRTSIHAMDAFVGLLTADEEEMGAAAPTAPSLIALSDDTAGSVKEELLNATSRISKLADMVSTGSSRISDQVFGRDSASATLSWKVRMSRDSGLKDLEVRSAVVTMRYNSDTQAWGVTPESAREILIQTEAAIDDLLVANGLREDVKPQSQGTEPNPARLAQQAAAPKQERHPADQYRELMLKATKGGRSKVLEQLKTVRLDLRVADALSESDARRSVVSALSAQGIAVDENSDNILSMSIEAHGLTVTSDGLSQTWNVLYGDASLLMPTLMVSEDAFWHGYTSTANSSYHWHWYGPNSERDWSAPVARSLTNGLIKDMSSHAGSAVKLPSVDEFRSLYERRLQRPLKYETWANGNMSVHGDSPVLSYAMFYSHEDAENDLEKIVYDEISTARRRGELNRIGFGSISSISAELHRTTGAITIRRPMHSLKITERISASGFAVVVPHPGVGIWIYGPNLHYDFLRTDVRRELAQCKPAAEPCPCRR